MDLESEGKVTAPRDVDAIHRNKTGALICWPARAGALIGGANPDDLRAVTKYSARLGLLFQITDDILDVTQTAEALGKTAAKDLAAGKATYPSVYGLDGSRTLAAQVHSEALKFLDMIDRPTGLLAGIADFVARREA
jgi:geranylgeranyl diphosphate synthase type II